jgi:large subunit ribosomal protein L10
LPISKERKEEMVEQYVDMLQRSQGIVITEYRGINMPLFNEIRAKMREVGSSYNVTKNTLLKIALNEVGMAVPAELLAGPVAVGFAFENFPGTIKALLDVTKNAELLILKGAIAQTDVYQQSDLKTLSELPSLDELRATLAGMIVQPAAQLISLMVAPQRDVVSVIAAYLDKNKEDGDEDAA